MDISALKVGVTGHRPNRLQIGELTVRERLHDVLSALAAGAQNAGRPVPPIAVSALAEGADRLFAAVALELGYRLDVLLPFVSRDYETTFGDATTTDGYRALLDRAAHVTSLDGVLADATAAYEAVGRATVDASDVLVTVWDGKPSAGRGGTADIIAYSLERGIPVIWIDATQDRMPRLLEAEGVLLPKRSLSAGARNLTARALTALGAAANLKARAD
jgi:hypothetical protein